RHPAAALTYGVGHMPPASSASVARNTQTRSAVGLSSADLYVCCRIEQSDVDCLRPSPASCVEGALPHSSLAVSIDISPRDAVKEVDDRHLVSARTKPLLQSWRCSILTDLKGPPLGIGDLDRRLEEHHQFL